MGLEILFAPTELAVVCDRCCYEHSAPTELNAFWMRLKAAL